MARGPDAAPTRSWWLANMSSEPEYLLSPPPFADIVVIGAGMTGVSVAYWLKRLYGRSCLLLDARGVAGGATGRNGGHLWPRPGSDFEAEVTHELLQFIAEQNMSCDLNTELGSVAVDGSVGIEFGQSVMDPEDDAEKLQNWEGEGVCDWSEDECREALNTNAFQSAIFYPRAIQFFPAKVAQRLLEVSGASACCPAVVRDIERADAEGRVLVRTDRGDVSAAIVVVATNAWAGQLLPELTPFLTPTRNHVIMTAPLPGARSWKVGGLSAGDASKEIYCIMRSDGRMCIGGARALEGSALGSMDDSSLSDVCSSALKRFLSECFPALGFTDELVESEWTGVLGLSKDGCPLCGPLPQRPNIFVAVGFSGHGMPQCFGVGKGIAQWIEEGDQKLHPFLQGPANVRRFLS
jgi:glycine/D-amino acid oxidase-like deaminating enzyme